MDILGICCRSLWMKVIRPGGRIYSAEVGLYEKEKMIFKKLLFTFYFLRVMLSCS